MIKRTDKPKVKVKSVKPKPDTQWKDYELVYQGGRHDVYCNGYTHVRTPGGYNHPPTEFGDLDFNGLRLFPCDCEYWARRWDEAMSREN